MILNEYNFILILVLLSIFISTIIVVASYIFAVQKPDSAKLSSYECGFEPMGSPRQQFEVRFFLVAILFIIFDIEVTLILPFALVISSISLIGFTSILVFIIVLTLGLVYEWCSGALEWQ